MTDSNIITLNKPEQNDPLQEVLREGARKMLAAAIEAEIAIFIEQHSALQTDEGKAVVVRNGYLPQRPIQTGLGCFVCSTITECWLLCPRSLSDFSALTRTIW